MSKQKQSSELSKIQTAYDSSNKSLAAMFPGWSDTRPQESVMVGLPATGAAYFAGMSGIARTNDDGWNPLGLATGAGEMPIKRVLPESRAARYAVLRLMAKDPTIDSAIKMHISNALSSKSDTVDSVFISDREDGKEDKIVTELRSVLMPIINKNLNEWARKAAVYGSCFARIHGQEGVGLINVRCDYYTHPAHIQKYEKAGRLAGFTTTF